MSTSHTCLSGCTRRDPKQRRGEKRVDDLLRAAVAEFAAAGYEGATMSGIARRAGASIGSLYQFFPDKEAVARALRTQHIEDIERQWRGWETGGTIGPRSVDGFVDRFVDLMIVFVEEHPAFLPLQDAPASTQPIEPRNRLRGRLGQMLLAAVPVVRRARLGPSDAARTAEVILITNKALMGLYARAAQTDRSWIERQYREILRGLLDRALRPARPAHRKRKTAARRPIRSRHS